MPDNSCSGIAGMPAGEASGRMPGSTFSHISGSEAITVRSVMAAMEQIAPADMAEPWDHVGLQLGDPCTPVSSVLLTLDVTEQAVEQACQSGCSLIISHHPLIFHPLDSICADQPGQRMLMHLIKSGISVFAAHTNLDLAAGGVADSLARAVCSLLGRSAQIQGVLATYGRFLTLQEPRSWFEIRRILLQSMNPCSCLPNADEDRPVSGLAVFPGSLSEEWIGEVRASRADLVICGEIKHSTGLALAMSGMTALAIGHAASEQPVLASLQHMLSAQLPDLRFALAPGLDYNRVAF